MNIIESPKDHILRTYYDLEPRKYSSDCVVYVRVTEVVRHGKAKEELHKELVLIPCQRKVLGDEMAKRAMEWLNKTKDESKGID